MPHKIDFEIWDSELGKMMDILSKAQETGHWGFLEGLEKNDPESCAIVERFCEGIGEVTMKHEMAAIKSGDFKKLRAVNVSTLQMMLGLMYNVMVKQFNSHIQNN